MEKENNPFEQSEVDEELQGLQEGWATELQGWTDEKLEKVLDLKKEALNKEGLSEKQIKLLKANISSIEAAIQVRKAGIK